MTGRRTLAALRACAMLTGVGAAAVLAWTAVPALGASGVAFKPGVEVKGPSGGAHAPPQTFLYAVSCTGNGACVGGGQYEDLGGHFQAMAAKQSGGAWAHGAKLAMPAGAPRQPYAAVNGVTCMSAGNCVAVGSYDHDTQFHSQAFIAVEKSGVWKRAFTPKLPSNASTAPVEAALQAVACTTKGACTAVGEYADTSGNGQAMAISKPAGGNWGQAVQIPAPANAAADPGMFPTGLACRSAGTCVAVGDYIASTSATAAMGAVDTGGVWAQAQAISSPANAAANGFAAIRSVSCLATGPCVGVGDYLVSPNVYRGMSVTESGAAFSPGAEINALPPHHAATPSMALESVSCAPNGPCVAVGDGANSAGHDVALYVTRSAGQWTDAQFLPMPANAATGANQESRLFGVACVKGPHCTVVGFYRAGANVWRAVAASTG